MTILLFFIYNNVSHSLMLKRDEVELINHIWDLPYKTGISLQFCDVKCILNNSVPYNSFLN